MSLWVSLTNTTDAVKEEIWIRIGGRVASLSRKEWDELYSEIEPFVLRGEPDGFSANITHNLSAMADAAGIYEAIWKPASLGYTKASDLIEPLAFGLARLKAYPDHFKRFNPDNGWGNYGGFVEWVEEYLAACRKSPNAEVSASG